MIETHPDQNFDLRMDNPFPELAAFAHSFKLNGMEPNQKTHVPYIVILIQAVSNWKATVFLLFKDISSLSFTFIF